MSKICLITGASRGIGSAIYKAVTAAGHTAIGLVRNPKDVSGEAYRVDVTDRASIETAVEQVVAKHGRIDVLINNAGYGLLGPIELVSEEEMQKQFDVNVFGVVRMAQAVMPHMRAAKSGLIINISSLSGVRTGVGTGLYAATKFAVESITTSLASQLAPWNIRAISVNPGWVHTEFMEESSVGTRLKEHPYGPLIEGYARYANKGITGGQDPREVGELVARLIDSDDPDIINATTPFGKSLIDGVLVDPTGRAQVEENRAEAARLIGNE